MASDRRFRGRSQTSQPVRELAQRYCNWGRWGEDDQMGTLNLVTPEMIRDAATLVFKGKAISMAVPFDSDGPQNGGLGRFNPIHLMIRDGADAIAGTAIRDFYGGVDRHFRGTDDIIIMPLQSGTQWDAMGHVVFENKIFNGFSADQVTSKGALKGDVRQASTPWSAGVSCWTFPAHWASIGWNQGMRFPATNSNRLPTAAASRSAKETFSSFAPEPWPSGGRGGWGDYAGG